MFKSLVVLCVAVTKELRQLVQNEGPMVKQCIAYLSPHLKPLSIYHISLHKG